MVFVFAFLGAALVTLALTPVVRRAAVALGVLDRPDSRKIHATPVPRWGGVAVGVGAALAVAGTLFASPSLRAALLAGNGTAHWAALGAATLAVLVAGAVDDARGLPAFAKLLLECAAAAVVVLVAGVPYAIALGPATEALEIGPAGVLFGVLWIVTLTNAVNMTDVVDGVAGGLGAVAALALGLVSIALGGVVAGVVLLGLAGALVGFLPHNFRAPRMFLGDSGSLVVGFLLGAASLVGLTRDGVWLILPAALALGVPLAECGITIARRILRAVTIERATEPHERFLFHSGPPRLFTPDARHIPHRLLWLGLSQRGALAVLYGGAAALGGLAVAAVRWPWLGLWGGVAVALALTYAAARWLYDELRLLDRGALLPLFDNRVVHHRGLHALYDAAAAAAAFLLVTWIVPGAEPTGPVLSVQLAVVVAATLGGLRLGGMYRTAFLHAGIAVGLRAMRAALAGALLAGLAQRALVGAAWSLVAWLLYLYFLLTVVVGGRFMFRVLEYLHQRATSGTRRALIFGAGRSGRLALDAMLSKPELGFVPVGFVDDDPRLRQSEVHGYPVHGGSEQLEVVLEQLRPDDLVLAVRNSPPEWRAELATACRRRGVRVLAFDVQWQAVEPAVTVREPVIAGHARA